MRTKKHSHSPSWLVDFKMSYFKTLLKYRIITKKTNDIYYPYVIIMSVNFEARNPKL